MAIPSRWRHEVRRSQDGQHPEDRAARRRRGIDVLFDHLQVRTRLIDLVSDVGKVAQERPRRSRRVTTSITSAEN
jgi:hypothetical protein